ncbi:glycosyltransferase family 2 protein [Woodsholea maritima]|uniref:glycosyltransferase family 2 protein n=1 Tax=Woodsholea maritima TaxID=240237 RepID=UPI00036523D7|nr:glycosyltransferase family 2 protein [Woodsholea maritima]
MSVDLNAYRLAILLPAYNEALSIEAVIDKARAVLPRADIYVFDNNSSDNTSDLARKAGAIVRFEPHQGKGEVVRRMFGDIDADIYVMVDADLTYDFDRAPDLIERLILNHLDMVVGARVPDHDEVHRKGHTFGNKIFNQVVELLFGCQFQDIFSGFRVFSRRFVKSFPAQSQGFDIETEMTIHALEMRLPCDEVPTAFKERVEGSHSKLKTLQDGSLILFRIFQLLKDHRPTLFFGVISMACILASLVVGAPVIIEYFQTGLVPKLPSAVLAVGLMMLSAVNFTAGLILGTVSRGHKNVKRFAYLAIPVLPVHLKDPHP